MTELRLRRILWISAAAIAAALVAVARGNLSDTDRFIRVTLAPIL